MSWAGTGGWTATEKRLMGDRMLKQEVQAKDISEEKSVSSNRAGGSLNV